MRERKKFQLTVHLPTDVRMGLDAAAQLKGVTPNQHFADIGVEALKGRADEALNIARLTDRVARLEDKVENDSANIVESLENVVKAVSELGDRFNDLAEGVERLAERVAAYKLAATGGLVQVIDTPASANGSADGTIPT